MRKSVSIIIPVYKTENTLKECLDSVLIQDYPRLEILLIDDGSPDHCPALCEEFAAQYEQVRVIHQKNQGLGMARNTGLAAASGDYVCFIDSDDCLDGPHAISLLVNTAEETHADITVGSFRRFNEHGKSKKNLPHLRAGKYTRTVDFRFKGFYMYGHLAYDWGKLYRREFLQKNNLWCKAYPFTQDKAHNMECYACEPVYAFVNESVYLYRINEDSVTFRYKKNLMPVWISIAENFLKFLEERNITHSYEDLTAFHIFFGAFFLVKQELQFQKDVLHGILASAKILKKYASHPFFQREMHQLARGRYLNQIRARSWKVVIRMTAVAFCLHAYLPLAVGIACLRGLEIDSRITRARYQ